MAQYNGYVIVPHNSYQEWRDATLDNGYNVDYAFGDQCWDFCALLYWQYGLILQTGNGTAEGCWRLMRSANAVPPFTAVFNKNDIKRGDIVVIGPNPYSYAGHICFADEDYNGTDRLNCLGQNQRGNGSGYPVTVDSINLAYFFGVFRNSNWQGTPPSEPETGYNKHRYNFVLFNRRKRQEKWTKKPLRRR